MIKLLIFEVVVNGLVILFGYKLAKLRGFR